jgi:hypothetical protein
MIFMPFEFPRGAGPFRARSQDAVTRISTRGPMNDSAAGIGIFPQTEIAGAAGGGNKIRRGFAKSPDRVIFFPFNLIWAFGKAPIEWKIKSGREPVQIYKIAVLKSNDSKQFS